MAADAVIDVDRGVISRFRDGLRGLCDDDLAGMARQSPAVHFASCVRIQNKDNEPIQSVPNILQLRRSEVYGGGHSLLSHSMGTVGGTPNTVRLAHDFVTEGFGHSARRLIHSRRPIGKTDSIGRDAHAP